jgi:hypothetical protein
VTRCNGGEAVLEAANRPTPCCLEKPLGSRALPVPQSATGGQGENPKARERTLAKELGKIVP